MLGGGNHNFSGERGILGMVNDGGLCLVGKGTPMENKTIQKPRSGGRVKMSSGLAPLFYHSKDA